MGIKDFMLDKSDSYRFYKENYEKNQSNQNTSKELEDLKKEVKKLKKDLKKQKKYINAYNDLFNSLFLDYEFKPRKLLYNSQILSYELLKFVNNICLENDLTWWLDYGSLLGAVRHENFIPWDDDTDIGMMREDSYKFNEIFLNEIERHDLKDFIKINYIPRGEKDRKAETFMQIFIVQEIYNGTLQAFAGVDVFPYDYIVDFDEESFDDVYIKAQSDYFNNLFDKKDDALETLFNDLNLTFEKTDHIINGVEGFRGPKNSMPLAIYDTDKIFPLKEMKFGPLSCPCPNDHDHYLRGIYNDYMIIPKSARHHNRLNRLRYNPNNDELYEKCISKFKKVNESYE